MSIPSCPPVEVSWKKTASVKEHFGQRVSLSRARVGSKHAYLSIIAVAARSCKSFLKTVFSSGLLGSASTLSPQCLHLKMSFPLASSF